jgi:XTP/dITP diphosphohydrolase
MSARLSLFVASSNPGKLREYAELSLGTPVTTEPLPFFQEIPPFDESAPTFAENSAGKALHYSRHTDGLVLADDSGLVVPALGGAPGVLSARYAGPEASDADRIRKLLGEMEGKKRTERSARFVCITTIAREGKALIVASDFAEGILAKAPRGTNGFGYDPIFYIPSLERTYAELPSAQKDQLSHRGKAFRKAVSLLAGRDFAF